MFIFLDESGNLGFDHNKSNNSKYFIVTILVFNNAQTKKLIEIAVKRTLKKINGKKGKNSIIEELKGSDTTIKIKNYFFRQLPQNDWEIYSVILNKEKAAHKHLNTKIGKKKLYNYLSKFIIGKVNFPSSVKHINLIVDRCKPKKEEIKEFNEYVENSLYSILPVDIRTYITHGNSCDIECLQAVDMFCWGIARKHTHNDNEWYSVFYRRGLLNFVFKIIFEEVYSP